MLEPFPVVLSGNHAESTCGGAGSPVAAGFALHENELDIVLDDGVGFVGFSEKAARPVVHFIDRVGDFVPDDGSEVVESDSPAALLNRGMERDNGVASLVLPAGEADIADDADEAPARDEGTEAVAPDAVEFIEEGFVILNVAHLPGRVAVLLKGPIWGRGHDEVNAFLGQMVQSAGVACVKPVMGGNPLDRFLDQLHEFRIFCNSGDGCLGIVQRK